jgi:hypothetical protein
MTKDHCVRFQSLSAGCVASVFKKRNQLTGAFDKAGEVAVVVTDGKLEQGLVVNVGELHRSDFTS